MSLYVLGWRENPSGEICHNTSQAGPMHVKDTDVMLAT